MEDLSFSLCLLLQLRELGEVGVQSLIPIRQDLDLLDEDLFLLSHLRDQGLARLDDLVPFVDRLLQSNPLPLSLIYYTTSGEDITPRS